MARRRTKQLQHYQPCMCSCRYFAATVTVLKHLKRTHGSSNSSNGTIVLAVSLLLNSAGNQNSFSAASAFMLLLRPLSGLRLLPRRFGVLLTLLGLLLELLGADMVATLLLLLFLLTDAGVLRTAVLLLAAAGDKAETTAA